MFKQQLKEWHQNRYKYTGIKPTFEGLWCVQNRKIVPDLKAAVLIRGSVK